MCHWSHRKGFEWGLEGLYVKGFEHWKDKERVMTKGLNQRREEGAMKYSREPGLGEILWNLIDDYWRGLQLRQTKENLMSRMSTSFVHFYFPHQWVKFLTLSSPRQMKFNMDSSSIDNFAPSELWKAPVVFNKYSVKTVKNVSTQSSLITFWFFYSIHNCFKRTRKNLLHAQCVNLEDVGAPRSLETIMVSYPAEHCAGSNKC